MKQGDQVGPYCLEEELGQGGMGTVWRAGPVAGGGAVALKLLAGDPGPDALARFRAEIRTLGRFDHPGVVRLLDHGQTASGSPWYAMDLLQGQPLSHWLGGVSSPGKSTHWTHALPTTHTASSMTPSVASATTLGLSKPGLRPPEGPVGPQEELDVIAWPPVGVEVRLGLVAKVCHTLAMIHGLGVVHCDIKPENVVVTDEGVPVLVDFGIAEVIGRRVLSEALDVAGIQAGTPHYISPEQILGEPLDARADLYALGCILYECVCGKPPFAHGSAIGIMLRHLSEQPVPLCRRVEGVPQELSDVVEELLSKSPSERPGYAIGVAQRVVQAVRCVVAPWRAPAPKPYLYRTEMTGQSQEVLRGFDDVLVQADRQVGVAWCGIGGEDGMGKSRMAAETIALARQRRFLVLSSQCVAHGAMQLRAFEPLLHYVADLGIKDPTLPRSWLGEDLELLIPYAPALARFSQGGQGGGAAEEVSQADRRVFRALGQVFVRLSQSSAVLYVVDDVHCADAFSLEALGWLRARLKPERGVVFLLSSRLPSQSPQVDRMLTLARAIRLEALDAEQVHAMAAQMLGQRTLPAELLEFVVVQTQGNPFYVGEYMHLALERGLLRLSEAGHWAFDPRMKQGWEEALPTPESIQSLCQARLGGLEPQARLVCEMLSVWEKECGRADVLALMEQPALGALAMLEHAEIVHAQADGTVYFAHEQLRQAAYKALPPARAAHWHRRIATYLSRRHPQALPARIGHHWEEAGERAQAQRAYLVGAREAYTLQAYRVADTLFVRALGVTQEREDHVALQIEHVEQALMPLRAFLRAQQALMGVLKSLRQLGLGGSKQAHVLGLLGRVELEMGEEDAARRHLQEAHDRFGQMADGQGFAGVMLGLGHLELRGGQLERARVSATQAQASFMRLGNELGLAKSLSLLGEIAWLQGRFQEAEQTFRRACTLCQRVGQVRMLAQGHLWLAQLLLARGDEAGASGHMRQASQFFRNAEDPSGQAQVAILCSRRARGQGQSDKALEHAREARALARGVGDDHHEALALCEVVLCQHELGEDVTGSWEEVGRLAGGDGRLAGVVEQVGRRIGEVEADDTTIL